MKQDVGIRKYGNCIAALVCIAVNVVLMGICFDFYYDLNDDVVMHDIMAGVYSGTPDGHNMQTLYPLGALIALCYRVCRRIPWYGLFLCLCQFGSFYLVGVRLCALCGNRTGYMGRSHAANVAYVVKEGSGDSAIEGNTAGGGRLLFRKGVMLIGLSLYLWGVCLSHLISIQYTVTCTMLSAAAIFLFLTTPDGLNTQQFVVKNIPSAILVIIAYQLRSEMLLLTSPLICLAGLYRIVEERKPLARENLCRYGGVLGMILVGMLLSYGADELAYGSAEWKDFKAFFDARTTVYDFYPELIGDERYSGALTELGVAPYQQTLLYHYNFGLDETIDTALLSRLADYAVQAIGATRDWRTIFREKCSLYRYRTFHSGDAPYNVMVLWGYAAVFLAGVLTVWRTRAGKNGAQRGGKLARVTGNGGNRADMGAGGRYAFVWQLLLLAAVRSALWLFILLRGRDPVRITHSLYLAEFALLMGMLARGLRACGSAMRDSATVGKRSSDPRMGMRKGVARGMALLAGLILAGAAMGSVPAVREDQRIREQVNGDRDAIDVYCREREDNFYFEDVYSTVAFSRRLFDSADNSYANYDIMGGWICKSPLYREKLQRAGITSAGEALCTQDQVYLIMSDAECEARGLEWITAYYAAHHIEVTVEQADAIGETEQYHVYQIREN